MHVAKNQEAKTEAVAQSINLQQSDNNSVTQLADNRPKTSALYQLQKIAHTSPQAQKAAQIQAMADSYAVKQQTIFGNAPIQQKRKSKKAGWNDKQKAQNERLFRRRAERQERYAAARERERTAILSGMKNAQRISFEGLSGPIQLGLRNLYNIGFTQQNSSGRAVFNKAGNFHDCMVAAQRIVGDLGHNRENGVATNPLGAIKERYMVNWRGINVIVRNFSSNAAILGTIEFQTGVVFEFKYQ